MRGSIRSDLVKQLRRPSDLYRGHLAEDYDGIGQYILVSMSRGSTAAALRARIAAGDFGGDRLFPVGTPVVMHSHHGQLEVLSLGNLRIGCPCEENFNRTVVGALGTGGLGLWTNPGGEPASTFSVDGTHGVFNMAGNAQNQVALSGIVLPFETLSEIQCVGRDPWVGWSGTGASGRSDFSFDTQLDPGFYAARRAHTTCFMDGTYPSSFLSLGVIDGRVSLGNLDVRFTTPVTWPVDNQTVEPLMIRFYVDDHGVYGRYWFKSQPEPFTFQDVPSPELVVGNVLPPFYATPSDRAIWVAGGWGKGEAWSTYRARLGGLTLPTSPPFSFYTTGGFGSKADVKVNSICLVRGASCP